MYKHVTIDACASSVHENTCISVTFVYTMHECHEKPVVDTDDSEIRENKLHLMNPTVHVNVSFSAVLTSKTL